MRTAFHSEFYKNHNGAKIGVFTGADFCAEHEWGIKRLRQSLGMLDDAIGIEARRIRKGENAHLEVEGDVAYLVLGEYAQDRKTGWRAKEGFDSAKAYVTRKHIQVAKDALYCEWDESSVLVAVRGKDSVELLKCIYAAIQAGDGFLGTSRQLPVFDNGGLVIMAVSNIPEEQIQKMKQADEDRIALLKASAATGIEERLKKTHTAGRTPYESDGCHWFALSPRWANETEKKKSKYPVVYWLNPMKQDTNNFGWFTVEQLDEWAVGKGPIPKK